MTDAKYRSSRAWRDELSDALGLKVSGVGITTNTTENTQDFSTLADLNDYLTANIQLNHDRSFASSIYPHIHYFQAENNVPNFLIQYRWQVNGAAKVTAWTDLVCNNSAFTYVSGTIHQIAYAAGIASPVGSTVSDIIQFRIIRDNDNDSALFAGADPYTATVGIMSFDCHMELDSNGSMAQYSK